MTRNNIRIVDSPTAFNACSAQWDALVTSTPLDHAYMRHHWFASWIEAYDIGDNVVVVTLWDGDKLRAAAPLRRTIEKKSGVSLRVLKFLQSPVSPRCNIIGSSREDIALILEAIYGIPNWDLLIMENLEESMPSTRHLLDVIASESDIRGRVSPGRQSPFMSIHGTWDDYLTSLNSARRGYIKNECIKRLGKAKGYSLYRLFAAQDADNIFTIMHDVSSRSWKGEQGSAIGQLSAMQKFYELYLPVGMKQGMIDVTVLEIEGDIAGFDCCLSCDNKFSGIRSDYDTKFKYYHPGENMRIAVIRHLFETGQPAEYDMGGDPAPFKMKWATGVRKHVNIAIANNTWRGKSIAFSRYTLKPLLDKILKRSSSADDGAQAPHTTGTASA